MDPDTARLKPGLRDRARQLRTLTPTPDTHEDEHIGNGTATSRRRVIIDNRGEGTPARNRREAP